MTDEQLARLPPAAAELIQIDRRRAAERGGQVHTLELAQRRRRVAIEVAKICRRGPLPAGDGRPTAVAANA